MLARAIAWGSGAVLLLAAVYGIWRFWTYDTAFFYNAAAVLPEQLAAAKAEGLPLEANDLRRNPPVPSNQNAAETYLKLGTQVESLYGFKTIPLTPLETWIDLPSSTSLKAAAVHLKTLEPLLKTLDKAVGRPHLDFHRKYELGPILEFREFPLLKSANKVLAYRGQIEYAEGRRAEAIRSLAAAFKVGAHCGEEPTLLALLVQIACDAVAVKAADRIASAAANDPQVLAELSKALQSLPDLPTLAHAFKAELASGRITCYQVPLKELTDWGLDEEEAARQRSIRVDKTVRQKAYDARVVELFRQVYAELKAHPRYGAGEKIDSVVQGLEAKLKADPTYLVAKVVSPMVGIAEESLKRMDIRRHLTLVKVKILGYRNAHGQYPATLAQAGINVTDPLSNKPIVYRATSFGFRAYSLGENGRDDGGVYHMNKQDDILVEHPVKPKNAKP